MSAYGIVTEAGTVRFERILPGPIERVWAYLTEPEKRAKWLAGGPMNLHAGGQVELHFRNADLSAQNEPTPERYKKYEAVTTHGRITRCDPPGLLSFSWGGEPSQESEVTFELTPQGDNVRLVLTHRRLVDRSGMLNVAGGWHAHLDILVARLNGAEPGPFWSTFVGLEKEYERQITAG